MVLKYYNIRYKSRGNNPINPFQFQFTCVQPVFLLVTSFINKLWLLEMYLLKGERSLSEETETVSTQLLLFRRDEMSDEKHKEIPRLFLAE